MSKDYIINGIKFRDYTDNDEFSGTVHNSARITAKEWIKSRSQKIKDKGVYTVELDTHGGLHYRHISSGRIIPIDTMHVLRFLKK